MNIINPRIIYKPAFRVAGISLDGEKVKSDLDGVWEKLAERYSEIPHADPDHGFGVHTFSCEGHRYLAGLAVEKDGSLPVGMAEESIGPNAYAVFIHRGVLGNLEETVLEIFDIWLPQSGYQLAEEFYFEFYDDQFQPGSEDSVVFIFVPVIEASP